MIYTVNHPGWHKPFVTSDPREASEAVHYVFGPEFLRALSRGCRVSGAGYTIEAAEPETRPPDPHVNAIARALQQRLRAGLGVRPGGARLGRP